jgi:hypothetical protein
MSVRGLAALAAVLLVLCAAAAVLLARRLGWQEMPKPADWVFVNPTLDVARGQRVVLRPILEGVPALRYTFLASVAEPGTDDPLAPVPHIVAGIEERNGDEWEYRPPPEALALCQMGALTPREWLEEIRPVREVGGAGGDRMLLRAVFGHRNGSVISYYVDPAQRVPAVGWTRSEMVTEGRMPEIHFASDGGMADVR